MKALIRNGEVYNEDDWSPYTKANLSWYCTKAPEGNDYALSDNAPSDSIASDYDISEVTESVPTGEIDDEGHEVTEEIARKVATLNRERYEARKASESELISEDADGSA